MKANEGVRKYWTNLVACSVQRRNAELRERGWKTSRQTQEEINGRECRAHIRGMRLSGSKILSWTLGDYPTGHHMMDCGLRVFGRQHCTCQACLSQTERCCMHVVAEWRRLWLLCDQPWGSKIIYKCFQEFTAFLNCRYKTLIISGPLWECMPDPYRIHLLTTKCVMKNLLASWNHDKKPVNLDQVIHSGQARKINRAKQVECRPNKHNTVCLWNVIVGKTQGQLAWLLQKQVNKDALSQVLDIFGMSFPHKDVM